jgi:hypothetical protein
VTGGCDNLVKIWKRRYRLKHFRFLWLGAGVVGEEKPWGHFAISNVSSNKNFFG